MTRVITRFGLMAFVAWAAPARADLVAGALDKSAPEAWAACAPVFARARARVRVPDVESNDADDSARLQFNRRGEDMCLSGSSYTLELRRAPGRDPRWSAITTSDEDGVGRRRYLRRLGGVEAIIDMTIWDGEDLSSQLLPILRAAAVRCAELVEAGRH